MDESGSKESMKLDPHTSSAKERRQAFKQPLTRQPTSHTDIPLEQPRTGAIRDSSTSQAEITFH
jgi:hypothetical protein